MHYSKTSNIDFDIFLDGRMYNCIPAIVHHLCDVLGDILTIRKGFKPNNEPKLLDFLAGI